MVDIKSVGYLNSIAYILKSKVTVLFLNKYLQYAGHYALYNYLKLWWQIFKICDYVVFQNSSGGTWAKKKKKKKVLCSLILSNHSFYRQGICNPESKVDLPKVT